MVALCLVFGAAELRFSRFVEKSAQVRLFQYSNAWL